MSRPVIEGFFVDEINETKIAGHGLSIRQVVQVLENRHVVIRNRKRRRGIYLVIGRDNGGACIAVPIEPTPEPTVWRPITAWPGKSSERALLAKGEKHNDR